MTKTIELPDPVYSALEEVARASGNDPAAWVAERVAEVRGQLAHGTEPGAGARTLGDLFAGRVGVIRSGGAEGLSEHGGKRLTDYLIAKREADHL